MPHKGDNSTGEIALFIAGMRSRTDEGEQRTNLSSELRIEPETLGPLHSTLPTPVSLHPLHFVL